MVGNNERLNSLFSMWFFDFWQVEFSINENGGVQSVNVEINVVNNLHPGNQSFTSRLGFGSSNKFDNRSVRILRYTEKLDDWQV